MILIDTPFNGFSHMVASDITELHAFAWGLDIKRCWFKNKRGKNQPHYDVHESLYKKAIAEGAKPVIKSELFNFLKQNYETKKN